MSYAAVTCGWISTERFKALRPPFDALHLDFSVKKLKGKNKRYWFKWVEIVREIALEQIYPSGMLSQKKEPLTEIHFFFPFLYSTP